MQILPLSLILLSEWWEKYTGTGAAGASPAGADTPALAIRRTFPALIPLTVALMVLSTGADAWRYYDIFETFRPVRQMQLKLGDFSQENVPAIRRLNATARLLQTEYARGEMNIAVTRTNDQKACNGIDSTCRFLQGRYVEVEVNLARIYSENRQFSNALEHLQLAFEMDTNSIFALNNLAFLRATAPDPGLRNGSEAVRLAERACQLTQHQNTIPLRTLAAAYAETGRFDAAAATAQRAYALDVTRAQNDAVAEDDKMITLFRSGRPYRQ